MTHQPPQTPPSGYGAPLPSYPGAPVAPQNGQTPPAGLPGQGGGPGFAPQPPPPPRRRTGLILTLVLVAVVLLAGGGYLAWSQLGGGDDTEARKGQEQSQGGEQNQERGQSQGQGQGQSQGQGDGEKPKGLTTPKVVKSGSAELRYDAKTTAQMYPPEKRKPELYPEMKGLTQTDAVYRPQDKPSVTLGVHTGTGTVSDPAQRVKAAFGPNSMAVAPKDFALQDPDAKGAVLRCGVAQGGGNYVPLCVWADSTSVGDVVGVGTASTPSLKKIDLKTLAQQTSDLRKAMRGGSAG
ncbi:hypothetical protein NCG97_05050 [Streptomyces lydicamycinicus]|uniref:Uncharacterized protein n=1 Tax=Streptomyces lydicamycinicus TaxID=1546107 RepID=A0A0P4RB71_9ACTN|nr:hypothetical protein [Streptomyces lydicamycinicus]USA00191.1 hypothetical protein NCG97_05050 [Streptomyces lydicamycinicus]GAO10290.1 hypothetical protein TPA0598_07_00140 [Streptomyces lydicamycinicus]